MSVTLDDVMKLPSMRHARIISGKDCLKNVVYGVAFLDFLGSKEFMDKFFSQPAEHVNRQIVLTSFADIADDVEAQCRYIRRLKHTGDVALVIYYVGLVLKQIDPKVLETANEVNFPIIIMPENKIDLRYSDLIAEVSHAVQADRMHYRESLVTEVIGQVTHLPSDRQTVDSVLSMLSSRLRVSVILTDSRLNVLGASSWPLQNDDIQNLITEDNVSHHVRRRKAFAPLPGSYIWYSPIHDAGTDPMRLFLIEEGTVLNDVLVDMAKETVQLAVELWSSKHSAVMTSELVKAILNDEPIRMRRLSELLNIDIQAIHTTWFIRRTDGKTSFSKEMIDFVRETMKQLDSDILLEPYRTLLGEADDLIIFFRNPLDVHLLDNCAQSIIDGLHNLGCGDVYLTMLDYKFTTSDVRNAFSSWNENESIARVAFPLLEVFHESEIELVRQCNEIIKLGEKSIAAATGCLDALVERQGSKEFLKTLEVYFLDAGMNMQRASEIMKVHKNTIKYRINMVSDALGFSVTNPITTSRLTMALCIRRLLDKANTN